MSMPSFEGFNGQRRDSSLLELRWISLGVYLSIVVFTLVLLVGIQLVNLSLSLSLARSFLNVCRSRVNLACCFSGPS